MGNNKKVLVVDDEAHIRRVIEIKLKKHGYQVITAINGKEGLNLIKTQKPDVVISDIMMPEMDGKALCKKTNSLKKERSFLTIIMTCRISNGVSRATLDGVSRNLIKASFLLNQVTSGTG